MTKKNQRPRILLTNDDGVNAHGLKALHEAMSKIGDCTILAPESEQSAMGHAITMRTPLRLKKYSNGNYEFGWSLNGTTADCVKFALHKLLKEKPHLIVSGINQGVNTAINTIYSGTVAGAAEGSLLNIPSMAISLGSYTYTDFEVSKEISIYFANLLLKKKLPDYTFLNINIPPGAKNKIKGIKVTHMGLMRYEEDFKEKTDPWGEKYFWLAGKQIIIDKSENSDQIAFTDNYVTVTPLRCDMTNYSAIEEIKNWNLKL